MRSGRSCKVIAKHATGGSSASHPYSVATGTIETPCHALAALAGPKLASVDA
jgi:hypothetical protein